MDSTDKDAYTKADQNAQATLRTQITQFAEGAVRHGVDREWANGWLTALGAMPVTGQSEYRLSVPITGTYGVAITATSRVEAQQIFEARITDLLDAGKINDCYSNGHNVYDIALNPAAGAITFYSGPEDPADGGKPTVLTTDELKTQIRAMLMQGVAERGWGYRWAQAAADHMGIPALPKRKYHTVNVPVQVSAPVTLTAFEGDDEAALAEVAQRMLSRLPSVSGKPVEIGTTVEVTGTEESTDY